MERVVELGHQVTKMLLRLAALVLSLLVFACTSPIAFPDAEPAAEGSESAQVSPAPPAAATEGTATAPAAAAPAAPACASKTGRAGDTAIALTSGGRAREAILHAPPSYDGSRPLPIVLVLHPLMLDHVQMRALVRMDRFADEGPGFLALYPNGIEKSWNAGPACCGKAREEKVDDVGFIRELLAEVSRTHCVDETRIFSTGFSNGAFLSHRLACDLGSTIRAIVPVAGTMAFPEAECKRTTPLPVLAFHGTDDKLAPYEGGKPGGAIGLLNVLFDAAGVFPAARSVNAFWAKHNGDSATTARSSVKGQVACDVHEGPAPVTLCTVNGGGHQWPGAEKPLPAMGPLTTDVDATEAAVTFFREQGL